MLKIKFNQVKAIIRREVKNGNYFEIYVLPCKVMYNNAWIKPYRIMANSLETFQNEINSYEYYNCNSELGKHLNYYITEEYSNYLKSEYDVKH